MQHLATVARSAELRQLWDEAQQLERCHTTESSTSHASEPAQATRQVGGGDGDMKLYLHEDDVFVNIGSGYFLCIGKMEEVKTATYDRVEEMIAQAVAQAKLYAIQSSTGETVH